MIRPATGYWDSQFIWELKNDPEVRKTSAIEREVLWDEHVHWFHKHVNEIWIIEEEGGSVGVIRVDPYGEVSIAIIAGERGKGYGKQAIRTIKTLVPMTLHARVRKDNPASIKVFEACDVEVELI